MLTVLNLAGPRPACQLKALPPYKTLPSYSTPRANQKYCCIIIML
jgi:hypothetical protein